MNPSSAIKTFVKKSLLKQAGKLRYQSMFETLLQISLTGMHIGQGGSVQQSGEIHALRAVDRLFPGMPLTVFDVGANVGDYAKSAQAVFGPRARIFSFEPSPTTFGRLEQSIAGLPSIQAFRFGLGERAQSLPLYTNEDGSGLASLYHRKLDHLQIRMDRHETVDIRTLDEFAASQGVERIHLLKLDIEGHELSALHGAKRYVEEDRIDVIQFEFGGCNIDSRTYFQDFFYLLKDRYQLYRLVKDGLYPLSGYKETYELFTTTNFLAIHRRHALR